MNPVCARDGFRHFLCRFAVLIVAWPLHFYAKTWSGIRFMAFLNGEFLNGEFLAARRILFIAK